MSIEELDPLILSLIEMQKDWDETTIPQTIDEIPLKPDILIALGKALEQVQAKVKKEGNEYIVTTNLEDLPALAGVTLAEPDNVDNPDGAEGDPHIYPGGRAKAGANYGYQAWKLEPGVYTTYELPEDMTRDVKVGEWVEWSNCWQKDRWFWMISATKYLADIRNVWGDTVFIEIRKGFVREEHRADYVVEWGYDPKREIFLFNVKDYPEGNTGFVAQYSVKTGKLVHFNRPGNYLIE